jgi:hypothetical protein
MNKAEPNSNLHAWFIPVVIASLLVWGGLVALGAFLGPNFWADATPSAADHSPEQTPAPARDNDPDSHHQLSPSFDVRKPLIVAGCVGAFVGWWGLLMWNRRRRILRQSAEMAEAALAQRVSPEGSPPSPLDG